MGIKEGRSAPRSCGGGAASHGVHRTPPGVRLLETPGLDSAGVLTEQLNF